MDYKYTLNDNITMNGSSSEPMRWIPTVEEESYQGYRDVVLQTKHFTNRKLFLTGEVTDTMANNFVSELLYLAEKNEPIDIYINSCGGSATAIKKTAESILETKKIINDILAKHTGKTVKEIDKATAFDNFMNAEETVKFGICDEVRNIF